MYHGQTRRQSKSIQGARRFCGRARINIMTDRCSLQKTQLRQSTAACMANSINARRWQIIHINTHKQPNINHICIVCANKQTYKTFATLNHVLGKNIVACEQTSSLFTRICRKWATKTKTITITSCVYFYFFIGSLSVLSGAAGACVCAMGERTLNFVWRGKRMHGKPCSVLKVVL